MKNQHFTTPQKIRHFLLVLLFFSFSDIILSETVVYPSPAGVDSSMEYSVKVNGIKSFVYPSKFVAGSGSSRGSFTTFSTSVTVPVEINTSVNINSVNIRPKKLALTYTQTSQHSIVVNVPSNCNLSVEINGNSATPLFIFSNPLEDSIPTPGTPNVIYIGPGLHTQNIRPTNGQTVYVAGGAVVLGNISTTGVSNFTVRGRGIIDPSNNTSSRTVRIVGGNNIMLEGVIFNSVVSWAVAIGTCTYVNLKNIKVISTPDIESDALDLVGCQHVNVSGGFFRSEDDCIVIKSRKDGFPLGIGNPEDIEVSGAVIHNGLHGNALEIGYELQGPSSDNSFVRNIRYKNIDIIHKGSETGNPNRRAAIGIHNNEDARVSNISYDDIRIEDCKENYLWMGVIKTGAAKSSIRGKIDSIFVKNIQADITSPQLPSVLNGYDATHKVTNVTFDNFKIGGLVMTSAALMNLTTNTYVSNVQFLGANPPSGLSYNNLTSSSFTLSWVASVTSGVNYQVLKDGVPIGTTTVCSYNVSALAPNTPYTITVRAFIGSSYSDASTPLVVATKQTQSITFNALPAKQIVDSDFSPNAVASSGLPVSYFSSDTTKAQIINGYIHLRGIGTCQITASQSGNMYFDCAADVVKTLTISSSPGMFDPIEDSYIYGGSPSSNYGGSNQLIVKNISTAYYRRSMLKFNLGSAKPTTVSSAKVRLYATTIQTTGFGVKVNEYTDNWSEMSINYTNSVAVGAAIDTVLVNNSGQYYEWDVTAYVQNQLTNRDTIISLSFEDNALSNQYIYFNSREASANRPQLVIVQTGKRVKELNGLIDSSTKIPHPAVSVYPNPSVGFAHIEFVNKDKMATRIQLCDISGALVSDQVVSNEELLLDTRLLKKGIYVIHVFNDRMHAKKKLIVR